MELWIFYGCGPNRIEKTTVVLCEIITVSFEDRDMFTLLQGVQISCKATVTSLPLVKGNLLILRKKPSQNFFGSFCKTLQHGCIKYQALVRWSASCQRDEVFYKPRCYHIFCLCRSEIGKEVLKLSNYIQIPNHLSAKIKLQGGFCILIIV